MLYFRSCPHCKTGTILLDSDQEGRFFLCLNCGWMVDLKQRQPVGAAVSNAATQEELEASPAPAARAA